jgi:hypothetical protein
LKSARKNEVDGKCSFVREAAFAHAAADAEYAQVASIRAIHQTTESGFDHVRTEGN